METTRCFKHKPTKAAITVKKGSNSEREMANAMYLWVLMERRSHDGFNFKEKPWKTFNLLERLVDS
jgi:hypothetical protein